VSDRCDEADQNDRSDGGLVRDDCFAALPKVPIRRYRPCLGGGHDCWSERHEESRRPKPQYY